MAYKNLLVHVDDSKACAGRLDAAMGLAQAHDAHLTGLYIAVDTLLPGSVTTEVPGGFLEMLRAQADERTKAAEAAFNATVERAGLSADCRTVPSPSGYVAEEIALHARYADLVVLGQPAPEGQGEVNAQVPEDVVLAGGRPALVVPYIGCASSKPHLPQKSEHSRPPPATVVGMPTTIMILVATLRETFLSRRFPFHALHATEAVGRRAGRKPGPEADSNLKRVMNIMGIGPLIEAMSAA